MAILFEMAAAEFPNLLSLLLSLIVSMPMCLFLCLSMFTFVCSFIQFVDCLSVHLRFVVVSILSLYPSVCVCVCVCVCV